MRLFKGIIGLVFIFLAIIFVYDIRFAIIFVSSYIFHELWHLILIKSFHFKVEEIHLIPFGGQIKMNCKKNHSPLIDAFIYLAGPLGNAILLVLSFIIKSDNLKMINLILFLFNLMPIMPLDGFYVLVNFLALKLPYFYALKICLIISIVFASGLLILAPFINYCFLILAGYMLFISLNEFISSNFYKGLLLERIVDESNNNPNKEIKPTIRLKKMLYKGYNTYFKLDGEIYFDKSFLKNNCKSNISKV